VAIDTENTSLNAGTYSDLTWQFIQINKALFPSWHIWVAPSLFWSSVGGVSKKPPFVGRLKQFWFSVGGSETKHLSVGNIQTNWSPKLAFCEHTWSYYQLHILVGDTKTVWLSVSNIVPKQLCCGQPLPNKWPKRLALARVTPLTNFHKTSAHLWPIGLSIFQYCDMALSW